MITQEVKVTLETDIVYVTGSVNDISCEWSYVGNGEWQTVAERAEGDIYKINITAFKSNGNSYDLVTTAYYGLNLITDRTSGDVNKVKLLLDKISAGTITTEELEEFKTAIKGAYNANDINRVGTAMNFVVDIFNGLCYNVDVSRDTNYTMQDIFSSKDIEKYLKDIEKIRMGFGVDFVAPKTPKKLNNYQEANDIERILENVYQFLQNMIAEFRYSGTFYAGEDDY